MVISSSASLREQIPLFAIYLFKRVNPEETCGVVGEDGFLAFFNGADPFLKNALEGTSRCFSELFFAGFPFAGLDLLMRFPPPDELPGFDFPPREEEVLFRGIGIF